MKKILCILLIFCSVGSFAQKSDIDCRLTKSFINQNMKEWNVFIDELSKEFEKTKSPDVQFKRAVVRHLYLAYLLFNDKNSSQIEVQLEGLGKDIEMLEKTAQYEKIVLALKSPYLAFVDYYCGSHVCYRMPLWKWPCVTGSREGRGSPAITARMSSGCSNVKSYLTARRFNALISSVQSRRSSTAEL